MHPLISEHLGFDDAVLDEQWRNLQAWLQQRFQREAGIEAILFLMGVQSRGYGFEPDMDKERKQDTIMEGTYCAFEKLGFYERVGLDENGFWIWERTVEEIPKLPLEGQEKLLKLGIILYFGEVPGRTASVRPRPFTVK
jgi:hypothetical protein